MGMVWMIRLTNARTNPVPRSTTDAPVIRTATVSAAAMRSRGEPFGRFMDRTFALDLCLSSLDTGTMLACQNPATLGRLTTELSPGCRNRSRHSYYVQERSSYQQFTSGTGLCPAAPVHRRTVPVGGRRWSRFRCGGIRLEAVRLPAPPRAKARDAAARLTHRVAATSLRRRPRRSGRPGARSSGLPGRSATGRAWR